VIAPVGARIAAAIDVGSNSVLLLTVAVASDGRARALDEAVATTRLGAGLRPGGPLDRDAARRTRDRVVEMAVRARDRGASDVWAFATGAVRRAADGTAFARDVADAAGVPLEVLSGAREAALAYDAAVHGLALGDATVLTIDVGGATTELTLGRGAMVEASVSLGIGALALAETCGTDLERAQATVAEALASTDLPARARGVGAPVVASGGTPTSLAVLALGLTRYDPRRVHGSLLDRDRLAALAEVGFRGGGGVLDPDRAALLPAGACILTGVLAASGTQHVRVSDHGVRHAYLRERLAHAGVTASMESLWEQMGSV
jgi:exopolyphosphatase/guanosine-5'-triphosphate,3'-diphosphate pyrophosphatase